jgi:hypothetical protein
MNFLNNDEELKQFIRIDYVKERNKFKFTKIDNTKIYKIDPLNCDKFLGLKKEEETEITSQGIEGSYINLTNYSHIIIKSNNILFEDNTQDNIDNVDFGNSSILFMIDKQDIPPFQLISYRNYDKSDNYSYNISNRQINSIDLHLYNEKESKKYWCVRIKPVLSLLIQEFFSFLVFFFNFDRRKLLVILFW